MLTDLSLAYVFFGVLYLQLQVQSALLSGWQTMAVTLLQTLKTTHTNITFNCVSSIYIETCMFAFILLSCSGWCSCVLGPLWSPISWPPCSDCAPPSSPSQTPADDSNQQTHARTRQAWVNTTVQPASNTHQHDSMCGTQKLLMKLKRVWQKDCFLLTPLI